MTYRVKITTSFKKGYKRAKRRGLDLDLLDHVIDTLRHREKLDAKYRDHELQGEWRGFHECHIQPDWLLIYLIEDDILTLTLTETGTHSDIFNKKRL